LIANLSIASIPAAQFAFALHAALTFIDVFSALRNLFVPSRPSTRSALAIPLHRLRAIAEWRSVTLPASNRDH
jgi:hypothetical protein